MAHELSALTRLFDLWLAGEVLQRPPAPLDTYVEIAARYLTGARGPEYLDRREWLPVMLVNTDGSCFTYGEPYGDPAWSIGTVFTDRFAEMLAGPVFERCAVAAERRVARNCLSCPFFDACGASLMAETESRERDGTAIRCRPGRLDSLAAPAWLLDACAALRAAAATGDERALDAEIDAPAGASKDPCSTAAPWTAARPSPSAATAAGSDSTWTTGPTRP
ncbi:hypothetical protein [Nocardia yunnanensis]|uniref:hypothetical protein n=1 Tax=Nocardia yunnanensis TaxID=2382165 RepID=UPI0013C515D0|nr:hypothetical protein [Nocardia yunnanensis]